MRQGKYTVDNVLSEIACFRQLLLDCPSSVSKVAMTAYFFTKSVPALDLRHARPSGCLPVREGLALVSAAGFTP